MNISDTTPSTMSVSRRVEG